MPAPDLLHSNPNASRAISLATPSKQLSEALTFGFARGEREERMIALTCPELPGSTFKKEAFAQDLFLDELIKSCFPLLADKRRIEVAAIYFKSVLTAPTGLLLDVEHRQSIFSELLSESPRLSLLKAAESSVRAFREALCGASQYETRSLGVRRRLDILSAFRRAIDDLMTATSSSVSGLRKVAEWIDGVSISEPYQRLLRLLEFENGRSVLVTQLQVGFDGRLRRFEIVGTRHASHKSFPRSGFSRFIRRVVSLLKGYRFAEEDVMSQLLDQIFSDLEGEVITVLRLAHQLEFYLRGLGFEEICREKGLKVCLPEVVSSHNPSRRRVLAGLFNPWLLGQGVRVVPCDLIHEDASTSTVVTGPNSGGKTRLMQALAVTQLLAQSGLFVPAESARLPQVEQLFLSLLEGAHADQAEGRLGLELSRIRQVFETCGKCSLVIMDELCSGTNPSEGERIFELVLELLEELRPQVLITTHFLDFAERLQAKNLPNLDFRQVEIGDAELPTYQFIPGVAKTSLAQSTAARVGVTRGELLALIHAHKRQEELPES